MFMLLQDESCNFLSGDERYIECQDLSVLEWLQKKIETVMILNMEDKPCPSEVWGVYISVVVNCLFSHQSNLTQIMYILMWNIFLSCATVHLRDISCLFLGKTEYMDPSFGGLINKSFIIYYTYSQFAILLKLMYILFEVLSLMSFKIKNLWDVM